MSLRSTAKYVRGGPPTSDTQVTEGEPVMLVFELMENGSLFDFLKEVWCSFSYLYHSQRLERRCKSVLL